MAISDRIKYDGPAQSLKGEDKQWLVYKFPGEDFVLGGQLIVNAAQEAAFYYTGEVLDIFGPGRHTLTKGNLPILQSFVNIPFGFKTPFTAEVYFINKISKLDMKWGTSTPFQVQDPKFGLIIDVRAFGQFGIKIKDAKKFLKEIIGVLSNNDLVDHRIVTKYFKGLLTAKIKDIIANLIINNNLSIFDISGSLDSISATCKDKISSEFDRFGLEVINLFIESINIPPNDVAKLKSILEKKAEFTQMGDQRYLIMRQLDVLEKLAANPGEGGGGMGLGAGLGAGVATGNLLGKMVIDMNNPPQSTKNMAPAKCPKCNHENPGEAHFCGKCGNKLLKENLLCPSCGKENQADNAFCLFCGKPLAGKKCPKCKAISSEESEFCINCGNKFKKD